MGFINAVLQRAKGNVFHWNDTHNKAINNVSHRIQQKLSNEEKKLALQVLSNAYHINEVFLSPDNDKSINISYKQVKELGVYDFQQIIMSLIKGNLKLLYSIYPELSDSIYNKLYEGQLNINQEESAMMLSQDLLTENFEDYCKQISFLSHIDPVASFAFTAHTKELILQTLRSMR